MKSIRSFLLSRLLGGTTLVLAAAGVAVYLVVTRSLESQFDRNLSDRVRGFASILFQVEDHVEFEFSQELMPEYEPGEAPSYFELWFEDGRLLERSNSLQARDLSVRGTPSFEPAHWTAPLPDGRPGRYVVQRIEVHHVYPEQGPDRPNAAHVFVVVALGREKLVAAQRTVLAYCIVGGIVLLGLITFLTWTAVHQGLEPANRLAARLDAIEVDRLPQGLDAGEMPAELRPVADKTDALIRRVDAALQRERRTSADIAHELRTPISELLTASEVALRDGRDVEGARRALRMVRNVAWRLGRTVSTLLELARLESGAQTFSREGVDLGVLVGETLRSLSALERERGLRIENWVEVGEQVEGDRDVLRIVVGNVLSNALYYSPIGGTVECRIVRAQEGWRFSVENRAVDLRPEDLRNLCEPFWRKDRARADRQRSGLGLALSRALAERTGLDLAFELEEQKLRAILVDTGSTALGRNPAPPA